MFQVKIESVFVVVAITFSFEEIETKGEEEANDAEESNDKDKWSSKGWQTISGWNPSPVSEGGSHDRWKQPNPSGKWKEVSNVWDFGSRWSRKRSTWQKSCRERLKRGQEVLVVAEEPEAQGSVDENTWANISRGLKRIRKIKEEEETLRELLDDVLDRGKQQKDEMWKELVDYMASRDTEKRRMSTLSTKIWQITQSNATGHQRQRTDVLREWSNRRGWRQ